MILVLFMTIYGVSGFTPTPASYDYFYYDGLRLTCSQDFKLCLIFNPSPTESYYINVSKKGAASYELVEKLIPLCKNTSICTLDSYHIAPDGSHLVLYSSVDKILKVYSINNTEIKLAQTIPDF